MNQFQVIPLADGPITVAYKQDGPYWIATALEFDILGTGKTRSEAFLQLQELVHLYLLDVLTATKPHQVFNPSPAETWDLNDKEKYNVQLLMQVRQKAFPESRRVMLRDMRPFRKKIREISLTPVCYS